MVIELKPTHISLFKNKIISIIDILAKYYPYVRIDKEDYAWNSLFKHCLWHYCHSDQYYKTIG